MTDPHQPSQPSQPGQPDQPWQQPYQPPPGFQPPPPERRSGLPGWAIALIVGGALVIVLCFVVAIVSIGVLTLLGGRVSAVFSEIESGLEEFATPTPLDTGDALSIGDTADLPDMRITITDARPLSDLPGARQPAPGQEYWAVEVTFENTSDRPVTLSAFSSSVQDTAGETYP